MGHISSLESAARRTQLRSLVRVDIDDKQSREMKLTSIGLGFLGFVLNAMISGYAAFSDPSSVMQGLMGAYCGICSFLVIVFGILYIGYY